jgi:hypothetical protein
MARQSNKTFYGGTAAGIGLVTSAWIGVDDLISILRASLTTIAGLALVYIGMHTRDDDVSDEGGTAPKDLPQPVPKPQPPEPAP